jgi:hypothetical protein
MFRTFRVNRTAATVLALFIILQQMLGYRRIVIHDGRSGRARHQPSSLAAHLRQGDVAIDK